MNDIRRDKNYVTQRMMNMHVEVYMVCMWRNDEFYFFVPPHAYHDRLWQTKEEMVGMRERERYVSGLLVDS